MRKQDLVKEVARKTKQPETLTSEFVNATFDTIVETLSGGDEVTITGFGTFGVTERAAREGRNPQTGEPMQIPAGKTPRFRPGTQLKRAVSDGS
jgi:DNA-binding protein HU-beta